MVDGNSTSPDPVRHRKSVLEAPEGFDADWQTKIAIAKKAKEDAKEARKGKPMAFKTHLFGSR